MQQGGNRPAFNANKVIDKGCYPGAMGFKIGFTREAQLTSVYFFAPFPSFLDVGCFGHKIAHVKFFPHLGSNFIDICNRHHHLGL